MTEVRIVPRVKTETKTIHTPVSRCGDNWFKPVKIRAPYKGTDVAYRTLPSLGDPLQVEGFDGILLEEMRGDLIRISTFVSANSSDLSAKQHGNIQRMIDRASRYLLDATSIMDGWASGFGTMSVGAIPAWPLGGQPTAPVNNLMEEGHSRDQAKYKKLVRAALRNLRCAEEVAKKATIRARNKMRRKGRRFAGLAGPTGPTPTPLPGETQEVTVQFQSIPASEVEESTEMELDDGELEEGEIILDEEDEPSAQDEIQEDEDEDEDEESAPTPTKKSKKKDNSLLLVGAAALGIMAMKGR